MAILFADVTAVTMDPAQGVIPHAYVVVEGKNIVSVGTQRPQGTFDRVISGEGRVLMPGLINAHTHVPMTLMRGYGGGHDLQHWLHDYIFPAEARLDDQAVAAGAALGLAEMIASGTTCIADMYMHTGTIAQEILKAGISANLSCGGVYFGAPEDFSPETCNDCRNQQELTEQWHGAGEGQILVDASIHAEYTSNPPLWQWMADYAAAHNLGMHCILKNHGLLAADETLEKAYSVMMEVENLARLYIGVRSIGEYKVLSDSEMDIVLAKFNNYGLNVEHKDKKTIIKSSKSKKK